MMMMMMIKMDSDICAGVCFFGFSYFLIPALHSAPLLWWHEVIISSV